MASRETMIRVGIADDYPVVLRGIEAILSPCPDMQLAFSAESIAQLMTCLAQTPIDVLLCDYAFDDDPQADGLDLLKRLRRHHPELKIIFLSAHAQPQIISSALELGAAGFIGKNRTDVVNLPQAIYCVQAGQVYLPQSLSASLLGSLYSVHSRQTGLGQLSERELVVARMICQGMSIAAIAERLKRSPKTISNQKVAAMKKLGVSNDVELSRVFQSLGH